MKKLKAFYNFNKSGLNFVMLIFLTSIFYFTLSIINSNFNISKILYFLFGILSLAGSAYLFFYILKQYKKSEEN